MTSIKDCAVKCFFLPLLLYVYFLLKMKRTTLFILSFTFCLGAFSQYLDQFQLQKLGFSLSAISKFYVDSVNQGKLTEYAIEGMLEKLDPHSSYLSPAEVKSANESLQGSFEGIGISFNMVNDTVTVIQSITGGPAEKLGILPGDKIIYVSDSLIAGVKMQTSDITKRLKGTKGTKVKVKILRDKRLIPFSIVRDKIPIYSVDAKYMIAPGIGYVKINRFASSTHQEVMEAISALKKKGMKSLIIDLQENGGGYLQSAIELADEFLDSQKLILYTEGANQPKELFTCQKSGDFETGKLVFLVDEYSASASEILSGAIQDWDRGLIIGRRTFGKGLVQRPLPLPDGSEIRLTVARYYTPSGRCIQRPYKEGKSKYEENILDRYKHGEFVSLDSISFPDSLRYKTLISERTVYGGGGIMPDIFVPADTTRYSKLHRELINDGIINKICLSYVDKNRKAILSKYPSFEIYDKSFDDSVIFTQLKADADAKKINFPEGEWMKAMPLLKVQLKALIARDLWDTNEYFEVINTKNDFVKKALEILQDNEQYNKLLKNQQ